jgi:hypothetical protein
MEKVDIFPCLTYDPLKEYHLCSFFKYVHWYVQLGCPILIHWHSTLLWILVFFLKYGHWYVQLGCLTLIHRHSTLICILVITTIKCMNCFKVWLLYMTNWQSYKFCNLILIQSKFAWVKRQPICKGNLIAHISIAPHMLWGLGQTNLYLSSLKTRV